MQIDAIYSLVNDELKQTEQLVEKSLASEVALINELSRHIIQSGGKRIRPLLVLLSAKAFAYSGEFHIHLAAIVELIHTATLLHDDVIDASLLRRGQSTANALWGNQASVLVGDYLYAHAFQLMVAMDNMEVLLALSESTKVIVQGEILQMQYSHHANTSEADYLGVIRCKTGKLFQTSAMLGAMIANAGLAEVKAIGEFGLRLGVAFQLVDDALDYQADPTKVGKNLGDDLAEGKITLPLIYALRHCSISEAQLIRSSIETGDLSHLTDILHIIETTQGIKYTLALAERMIRHAIRYLRQLPDSLYCNALKGLAEFAVQRGY